MAIPSKQIGWSQRSNLLWEISNQLDKTLKFICTGPCPVPPTTTTTTTITLDCNCYTIINNSNSSLIYSYIDCSGNLISDVPISSGETVNLCAYPSSIIINGGLILDEGLCGEVCNYSCNFYKVEAPAFPPGVGWLYSYVNCEGIFVQGAIGSGTEPQTNCMVVGSLTYFPEGLIVTNLGECLVNARSTFVECGLVDECTKFCEQPFAYYNVWMTQECIDSWPSIGCEVWLDEFKTTPFPDGGYSDGNGNGCIVITRGVVTAIL